MIGVSLPIVEVSHLKKKTERQHLNSSFQKSVVVKPTLIVKFPFDDEL
jgi:hypothetical protein